MAVEPPVLNVIADSVVPKSSVSVVAPPSRSVKPFTPTEFPEVSAVAV